MATSCFRRPRGSEPENEKEPENLNLNLKLQEELAELGVGGVTKEIEKIKRRVLNSRQITDDLKKIFGRVHVRGVLLHGPPGTGKTLIARAIGKILKVKDKNIKDVKGPEILDKWIGSSEKNMRELFSNAEKEYKKKGSESQLHLIIFDEIDAICKKRGSLADNTGVHDSIVTTLLVKLDSVEELNNILVIGLTNRKELIDEALLRPGRLEVHIPIVIPDEKGREEILNIHTKNMRVGKKLAEDVDIKNLVSMTIGFSGAEIAGLVRDAQSFALQPYFEGKKGKEALAEIKIAQEHFNQAIEAFRESSRKKDELSCLIADGIIPWCEEIENNIDNLKHLINLAKTNQSRLIRVLITGAPCTGKTALSAQLAIDSDFQNVELCSPNDMVGFTEHNKCLQIKQIFINANKSTTNCVLIDDIEILLGYRKKSSHYSNSVLQTLLVLLRKEPPPGTKLFILCTCSNPLALDEMELRSLFRTEVVLPNLTEPKHIIKVIEYLHSNDDGKKSIFNEDEITVINFLISDKSFKIGIKTMMEFIDTARQMKDETTERIVGFLSMIYPEESFHNVFSEIFPNKIKFKSRGLSNIVLSYNIESIFNSMSSPIEKTSFDQKHTTISNLKTEYEDIVNQFNNRRPIYIKSYANFFEAKSTIDNKIYAILLYPYLHDRIKNIIQSEINLFSKLKSKFMLQYKKSWIIEDEQETMEMKKNFDFNCVFIQTELWLKPLSVISKEFLGELDCRFFYENIIGFYIMAEIIEELFEAVNYLHQNNIIHRDLKPENIVISDFSNGRTVKIADFALTCISKTNSNDAINDMPFKQVENTQYSAAEIMLDNLSYPIFYNEKVDIYSLGMILTDFFDIWLDKMDPMFVRDINNEDFVSSINSKIGNLFKLASELIIINSDERPSCGEVLKNRNKYFVSLSDWNNYIGHISTQVDKPVGLIEKDKNYSNFILSKFSYRVINDYPIQSMKDSGLSNKNKHALFSMLLPDKIVKSYNGFYFCILLTHNGELYSFGENMFNQLGYETINEYNYTPKLIDLSNEKVIEVSCGRSHVLALTEKQEVYSWGSKYSGETGCNINEIILLPIKINGFNGEKIQSISCGSEHSMALNDNREVLSWGNNIYGQLGVSSTKNSHIPTKIKIANDVKISKISCGRIHSLLLTTKGDIYSFGANYNCQLGWKSTESNNEQIEPKPIELHPRIKFTDIRCHWRGDFSTALSTKSECYVWGKCGTDVIERPTPVSEIPMLREVVTCEQAVDELISENINN